MFQPSLSKKKKNDHSGIPPNQMAISRRKMVIHRHNFAQNLLTEPRCCWLLRFNHQNPGGQRQIFSGQHQWCLCYVYDLLTVNDSCPFQSQIIAQQELWNLLESRQYHELSSKYTDIIIYHQVSACNKPSTSITSIHYKYHQPASHISSNIINNFQLQSTGVKEHEQPSTSVNYHELSRTIINNSYCNSDQI